MIKIVKYTNEYETYTEQVENEDGIFESVEKQKEIVQDIRTGLADELKTRAKLLVDSWNQDSGYSENQGPYYKVVADNS